MPPYLAQEIDPVSEIYAVTASDTTDDPNGPFRGLIAGATGTLKLRTAANQDVTLASIAVGQPVFIRCKRVWTTGTSATGLFGFK